MTRWRSTCNRSGSTATALVVTVDHPAWATQVRRLGDTLLDRAADYAGVERPGRLEVRVKR